MRTSSTSPSELGSDPQVLRARIAELQRECADLHRAQQIHRGAGRVLESLTAGAPLDEVLHILIDTIEAVRPTMLGSVLLLEDNGRRLRLGAAPRLPDFYNEAIDGVVIGPAVGSCGTCAHTGERIIVEDVMTHPYWTDYREIAQRAGLRACWSHPIVSSTGRILGTFAMYYRRPQRPDTSDLELITFAAHLAGVAIERTRTETALRSSEQRLRALVQNAPMCIYEVDGDGRFVSMNPAGLRLHGMTNVSEIIGEVFLDCICETDRPRVTGLLEQAMGGHPAEFEFTSSFHDPPRVFTTSLVPLNDADGTVVRIMGVAQEITERIDAQQRQKLMVQELDHRVKNNLAAVISIIQQTASRSESVRDFEIALTGRISSMGLAHEMLAETGWQGVQLHDMLGRLLEPYRRDDASRIDLRGAAIKLPAAVATPICMVVHELAVNAAKYGSLSENEGRVFITWQHEPGADDHGHLRLTWSETGGPPVSPPTSRGRGTLLIERMLGYQLNGEARLDFEPAGVTCELRVPLADRHRSFMAGAEESGP